MSVTEYTNRELGILLEKLTEKIDTYHTEQEKRLAKIEFDVEENKAFRNKAVALISLVTVFGSTIATKVLANIGI